MKLNEFKKTMREVVATGNAEAAALITTEIIPKANTLMSRKGGRFAVSSLTALGMFLSCSTMAFATGTTDDVRARIDQASQEVLTFIQGILLSIGAVSLAVCGLVLLLGLGGQRASENAKAWAIRIFFGMAIVLMAKPIVEWVMSLMGASGTP